MLGQGDGVAAEVQTGGDSDPRRWRALGVLTFALILTMSTWFSASSVVPQLREIWGLSTGTASWLTIGVQLGFVAGAVLSSALNIADIVSPRVVILGGALGAAVANAGLLATDSASTAIPLRFATGVMLAGVYPPALKLMATWFRSGRGIALGVLVGALTLGSALPHLVNAVGGLEWQTVVLVTSTLTVLGGLVALTVHEGPYPFPRAVFDPRRAPAVLADRGVRLASLGYFGHMWELYAMWGWFLVFFRDFLAERGNDSGAQASLATFAVVGSGAIGCWLGGVLGDRWGRTRTTALSMGVSGLCALGIGLLFHEPTWIVLAVGLVWGISVVADSAQFSTMVTEMADQAYVGTALTLQLAIGFTLTVVTVWLIPRFEAAVGWRWAFALLAPGPALGLWAMLRLKSAPQARLIAGGKG